MKKLSKSLFQIPWVLLLVMLTMNACRDGRNVEQVMLNGDSINEFLTFCVQAPTDTKQTCAVINEQEVITYALDSHSQYAGVAIFFKCRVR